MEKEISVRAHHGMCFKYFKGEGYSDGFTKNMAEMKAFLENEDPEISVVNHADIVCKDCPNLVERNCLSYEKVNRYDEGVLSACELPSGQRLKYSDFSILVEEKVIKTGMREKICGDCQWTELCK